MVNPSLSNPEPSGLKKQQFPADFPGKYALGTNVSAELSQI
jgi:hypothetical protein